MITKELDILLHTVKLPWAGFIKIQKYKFVDYLRDEGKFQWFIFLSQSSYYLYCFESEYKLKPIIRLPNEIASIVNIFLDIINFYLANWTAVERCPWNKYKKIWYILFLHSAVVFRVKGQHQTKSN